MKNKKALVAIILVTCIAIVGVTFAYFQSSTSFTNIFNTGTYRVVTTEVFESPDNWAPGEEIEKTITSTNEGTIPAAVRVSYTEQWIKNINGVDTDITDQVDEGTAIINFDNTSDWTQDGNYYYYNYILQPQETTTSFIESVTLNPLVGTVTCTPSQDGLTQDCSATDIVLGATYKLTITKETVQADKYQSAWNTNVEIIDDSNTPGPSIIIVSRPFLQIMDENKTKDTLELGDEICVNISQSQSECFNFLRYDGEYINMLAKYNLNIGDRSVGVPDGYQSSQATGGTYDLSFGGVNFSNTNYWTDGSSLSLDYGLSYPTNVYNTNYSSDSGNNYSVVHYVNAYKNKLNGYGLHATDARILSYNDALNIGCVSSTMTCPTTGDASFITNTSFWTSTAQGNTKVYSINKNGNIVAADYDSQDYGVRPIIVFHISEFRE